MELPCINLFDQGDLVEFLLSGRARKALRLRPGGPFVAARSSRLNQSKQLRFGIAEGTL